MKTAVVWGISAGEQRRKCVEALYLFTVWVFERLGYGVAGAYSLQQYVYHCSVDGRSSRSVLLCLDAGLGRELWSEEQYAASECE